MNSKFVKVLALSITAVMIISALSGCANSAKDNNKSDNPAFGHGDINDLVDSSKPDDGTLAVVNGESIYKEDVDEILPILRYVYQKNPTDDDWDDFYTYAIQYVASNRLYDLIMKENNLEVDENEVQKNLQSIKDAAENEDAFNEEIDKYDVTEEQILDFLRAEQKYTVVYNYFTDGIEITDDDINEYWEENKSSFEHVNTRDFYQMQFENEEDAQAALNKIKAGKSFDDVMDESDVIEGGLVGTVSEKELIPEFNDIAWGLDDGEVYDKVIKTDYGYHIIMVKNIVSDRTYTLDEVRDNIEQYVLETKKSNTIQEAINKATVKYKMTIY